MKRLGPAEQLQACYEARPTGYAVYGQLSALGVAGPYKGGAGCAKIEEVIESALEIYEDDPDILAWLKSYFELR